MAVEVVTFHQANTRGAILATNDHGVGPRSEVEEDRGLLGIIRCEAGRADGGGIGILLPVIIRGNQGASLIDIEGRIGQRTVHAGQGRPESAKENRLVRAAANDDTANEFKGV